jgi:hypothetical protein
VQGGVERYSLLSIDMLGRSVGREVETDNNVNGCIYMKRNIEQLMVNNSTNINKANNYFSP